MKRSITAALCICFGLSLPSAAEPKVYTYLGPGYADAYTRSLLILALEKSREKFGDYTLRFAPDMNDARALKSMKDNTYPNPIRRFETSDVILQNPLVEPIPFPIYLGLYSYRVCFVTKENLEAFKKAMSKELLHEFVHGLVKGWADIKALRFNGFTVRESVNLDSLYNLLSRGRVDVVCRSVTEIEIERHMYENIDNVVLDKSKTFFYPLPFFFYSRTMDKDVYERLRFGLLEAFEDGSLKDLWIEKHYKSFVESVLDNRQIISLSNSIEDHIPFSYHQYLYQPLKSGL